VCHPHYVCPTLELSCKAPVLPGFVSFNSLFGGIVFLVLWLVELPDSSDMATTFERSGQP
jgi:hypothetical protein